MFSNIRRAYLFQFLISLHFFSGVLIPFFTQWGGLTLTQTLLLQSWFVFWSFILEVPTGVIADRFGRKYSLVTGAMLGVVGALIYSSMPAIPVFLVGEILFAAAFACFSGADHAFLYDTLKDEKRENDISRITAKFEQMGLLGMMISAPLGSLIGASWGLEIPMRVSSIAFFFAFVVAMTLREPTQSNGNESTRMMDIFKNGIKRFRSERRIRWIAIDLAVVQDLSFTMIWLYQPLLSRLNVPIAWFGLIHAGLSAAQIALLKWFGSVKRWNIPLWLSVSAFLPGVLFLVGGMTTSLTLLIPAILMTPGFGISRLPLFSEELHGLIPSSERATVLSFIAMFQRFIRIGVNPIVGFLADRSLTLACVALGVTLLVFSGVRRKKIANLSDLTNSPN